MNAKQASYLKATLHLKKGKEKDFAECMAKLLPAVHKEVAWVLVSALTDNNEATGHTIHHLWQIPGPDSLDAAEEKLGKLPLYQEIMGHVADEKTELLTPTSYSSISTSDNDILVAAEDGGIYRIPEMYWHNEGNVIPQEDAARIKTTFIDNGVAVADIPQQNTGGFAAICYLLNLKMVGPRNR